MLPEDQTVDVVSIDEEEHEYGVKLRNSRPVVEPQTELKLETFKKVELEIGAKPALERGEGGICARRYRDFGASRISITVKGAMRSWAWKTVVFTNGHED